MTMKRLWVLAVSLLVVSAFALTAGAANKVQLMDQDTLKSKLDDPKVVVVDVRTGSDWRSSESKIKGAVRVEKGDVAGLAEKYKKDQTLVFYCA
ncbi:MAG: hypothetical protein ETSY1_39035 [Candidatus Entotheonella factor]|uniref:Rhodanese domain-containing protein n=2 Tax=Candidatus Entotheonella TaxID=93171 RepID=W4L721_ENTF1|nr:MAG: hypothetical protein ETSY1_39035 [Candidatus Entotheonella factor]